MEISIVVLSGMMYIFTIWIIVTLLDIIIDAVDIFINGLI